MVDAQKLRIEILKYLRSRNGEQKGLNGGNWATRLAAESALGFIGIEEVQSELKCMCAEGIVELTKWDTRLGGWYRYQPNDGPAIESLFFGWGTFDVQITSEGRWFLNVPRGPIGFQPRA